MALEVINDIAYLAFGLNPDTYRIKFQQSNRGDKYGLPHGCKYDDSFIEIGKPLVRLTEMKKIEYDYGRDKGTRPIFKSWLFCSEQHLILWLKDNNPEWIL